MNESALFKSFWIAGFEAAYHINRSGVRLDMIASTQHDVQAEEDYARLREVGIRTVRDGVRWHRVDHAGRFDFSSWAPMLQAALRQEIQVIWTLCHYGWPDDVDLFSAAFVDRFAGYCRAAARFHAEHSDEVPFYTLINEVSFLAWAIGHAGIIYPFALGRDAEVKRQLVRATIAGCEAIWSVDARARFVHGDPIIHVIAPRDRPDLAEAAAGQTAAQFDAWDMIAGKICPELGGHPRFLDIVAVHYYHANQWEHPQERLRWEDTPRDERWVPLHRLLQGVHIRYGRPLIMGETSHFGVGRARWLYEIGDEVARTRAIGVPLEGVCLYPIIDRHDWEDPAHWHNSGLWDLALDPDGQLRRVLYQEYLQAFHQIRGDDRVSS